MRVLVVDDNKPFRRFVCTTLEARLELQVVGEAADGFQAVQKAAELQPDLILLDVGMPTLNGIEAAHRILRFLPAPTMFFPIQENNADVVAAAFRNGGKAYVRKQNANSELLSAIETLLRGNRFVTQGLISQT
jgi:DNA-binding NarL/FixJ family response regulator